MEDMDVGYEEFAAAFDGDDGYQTETTEDTAETETTEETTEEAQDEPEGDDTAGEVTEEEAEKGGAEGGEKGDDGNSEQKFTIKVNKENREVGIQEMTELAQKGADYDRVKGQLETSRQNEQTLQTRLDEQKPYMDVLNLIAGETKVPLEQLAEQLYINFQKGNGKSETEAKQALENAKLKKENDTLKAQQTQKQAAEDSAAARAQRDLAEFRKQFPDVELTQELCEKLTSDIQAGMSLTNAYLKMENARKDAENAELRRKLAADEQNKRNRAKSPGSQRDSGGQRAKTDFDEFMSAFK